MRYVSPDDFGLPEDAFLTCRFWLIDAWWSLGRREEAHDLFIDALKLPQSLRPVVRGHRSARRELVGQFSADLFDGRTDPHRYAAVAKLGGSILARLIVVSNRVALPTRRAAHRPAGSRSRCGCPASSSAGIWFGWSGRASRQMRAGPARESTRRPYLHRHRSRRRRIIDEYYNGFANRVLWPILHYRLDLAEFSRRDLTGYHAGQRAFRQRTAQDPQARRCDLGSRLSPDSARPHAARARPSQPDRLFPAHSVSAA